MKLGAFQGRANPDKDKVDKFPVELKDLMAKILYEMIIESHRFWH